LISSENKNESDIYDTNKTVRKDRNISNFGIFFSMDPSEIEATVDSILPPVGSIKKTLKMCNFLSTQIFHS